MLQDIRQNASEKPVKEPRQTKRREGLENMMNECDDGKGQMSDCEKEAASMLADVDSKFLMSELQHRICKWCERDYLVEHYKEIRAKFKRTRPGGQSHGPSQG